MLTQSVPCEDISSATVQAVRVASRVEVAGNVNLESSVASRSSKSDSCSVKADVTVPGGR